MASPSFRTIVLGAFLIAFAAGCGPLREDEAAAPRSESEWRALVDDIRAFEERMGFVPTRNFRRAEKATAVFPFCGHVSPQYLPYSYEDPAIQWAEAGTEEACRALAGGNDMLFGEAEAMGQSASPVTAAMLRAPLPRFIYLVVHEDCHDQFELPYGIEEALCNALAHEGMSQFARERYGPSSAERASVERFVRAAAVYADSVRAIYDELAHLYAGQGSSGMDADALLRMRAEIFERGERRLEWPAGTLNNLWIAYAITYSRHHPVMQRALDALGGDLRRSVEIFRKIDRSKPAAAPFAASRGTTEGSVEFVRAYERALVELIERALAAGR